MFDGTFFGVEHALRTRNEPFPQMVTFALAAVVALCVDYPMDVGVKRNLALPPQTPVRHGPFLSTFHIIRTDGFKIYRGLTVKVMEFGVSYCVTGAVAPFVIKSFLAATAMVAMTTSYV